MSDLLDLVGREIMTELLSGKRAMIDHALDYSGNTECCHGKGNVRKADSVCSRRYA